MHNASCIQFGVYSVTGVMVCLLEIQYVMIDLCHISKGNLTASISNGTSYFFFLSKLSCSLLVYCIIPSPVKILARSRRNLCCVFTHRDFSTFAPRIASWFWKISRCDRTMISKFGGQKTCRKSWRPKTYRDCGKYRDLKIAAKTTHHC